MCPSYMATRDEQHTTRGRANVLRLAMAGRLGEAGLGDEACTTRSISASSAGRARRSARSASTWPASRASSSPTTGSGTARRCTRARSAARARAAEWGSRLAPLSNWIVNSGLGRRLNERVLGIDRRRALPAVQAAARSRKAASRPRPSNRQAAPDVLLFNDTFTNHYDPEIGLAALDVLSAAGLRPALAPNRCCGRPQISKGLLDDARGPWRRATPTCSSPTPSAGRPLVFCEPSCLSAIREDAPALLRGEARRRADVVARSQRALRGVSRRAMPRLTLKAGPEDDPAPRPLSSEVDGAASRRRRRCSSAIPETTVVDLDAGCCGMAGSFGYAREHYDVSRAIGERKLFPAVRSKPAGAVVVAAGTSCRHQIADFTGETRRASGRPARSDCSRRRAMNLAWLSLGALVHRHDRQLLQSAERRRARPGAGVDRRRVSRRHEARPRSMSGFPDADCF